MEGKGRRSKGAAAERELAKLLAEHLGTEIARNLEQTRDGWITPNNFKNRAQGGKL